MIDSFVLVSGRCLLFCFSVLGEFGFFGVFYFGLFVFDRRFFLEDFCGVWYWFYYYFYRFVYLFFRGLLEK